MNSRAKIAIVVGALVAGVGCPLRGWVRWRRLLYGQQTCP